MEVAALRSIYSMHVKQEKKQSTYLCVSCDYSLVKTRVREKNTRRKLTRLFTLQLNLYLNVCLFQMSYVVVCACVEVVYLLYWFE